ncbi:MAG: hypothetical protein IJZ63_05165, partial [Clostridia bacterium]|nr:hypothetical protein [Clostridia bacterium]
MAFKFAVSGYVGCVDDFEIEGLFVGIGIIVNGYQNRTRSAELDSSLCPVRSVFSVDAGNDSIVQRSDSYRYITNFNTLFRLKELSKGNSIGVTYTIEVIVCVFKDQIKFVDRIWFCNCNLNSGRNAEIIVGNGDLRCAKPAKGQGALRPISSISSVGCTRRTVSTISRRYGDLNIFRLDGQFTVINSGSRKQLANSNRGFGSVAILCRVCFLKLFNRICVLSIKDGNACQVADTL